MTAAHRKKLAHLRKSDPVMKLLIEGIELRELGKRRAYFEALVESIVSQQLSVKAADTIFERFRALTPGRKFPTPAEVMKMPAARMRKCGLSRMKVAFIKDLARRVLRGELDLKRLDRLGDEEVIGKLVAVKGIGRWTAEMFLIFSLQRDDIFSYGDLGLRNAVKTLYKLKKHPTPAQAAKISEKWKPYRSVASRYLWASLRNK